MIDQLPIQTRFKLPYKRSSNSLGTHTPYNPRRRLKTPEASERLTGHRTYAEAEEVPPARAANVEHNRSLTATESSRMGELAAAPGTNKRLRLNLRNWSDGKATTVAARGAP